MAGLFAINARETRRFQSASDARKRFRNISAASRMGTLRDVRG
jgi:hypothetical protein